MCGITGIVNLQEPCDREALVAMTNALTHRGPDADGFYVKDNVGLGHRRLSIIDLSPQGRQPMSNEDGTVWIVFNGEIYNFQELRGELEARGHTFRSNTDTETIVHLYEERGEGCVHSLRGMFAFAIWDERKQTLFLARDRLGKKPLLYSQRNDSIAFASEFQGLLKNPTVRRSVNYRALDSYLSLGYIPPPDTAFQYVAKLPPAHFLLWRNGQIQVQRYWQLAYEPKLPLNEREASETLLHELREAVRLRMISDVPLGVFLSGGIDSSAIVALMSEFSTSPVKTFSIGFDEKEFDELQHARTVARHFGTDHHEIVVRPNALEILPLLVRHYGEPYADSSAIPSYYVAKATREHVTVALNGDGGDESFAGYERYLGNLLAEKFQRLPSLVRGATDSMARLLPRSGNRRSRLRQARRFLQSAAKPSNERYADWLQAIPAMTKTELLHADFVREVSNGDGARGDWLSLLPSEISGLNPLDTILWTDVHSYLPYDLLVKMDIATMANSLEARSPLLDHKVMEFAARLPSHFKINGRQLKYLLKRTFAKKLPPEILARRKQGFGVPVGNWFRGELKPLLFDCLLSERARSRGLINRRAVQSLIDSHLQGKDHSGPLWTLLMLEMWFRGFAD